MREPSAEALASHWGLDRAVAHLNHGSFGATPTVVLAEQQRLRDRMERQPVRFFVRDLEPLLDAARADLAAFLGADPDDLALVPNATHGVNTVVRALRFEPGDELLTTDHAYNACANALTFAAERRGARVVVAAVPFPIADPGEVIAAVLAEVSARTRLVLLDHVTSPTGLVFPVEVLVRELAARGVDTLIDGAHAPGMLPLGLGALGAAYYTGNLHKWACAPKGAAFLHVRRDRQDAIRPLSVSHGANSPRRDRSRFRLEFDWTGTVDPTPWLAAPAALRFLGEILPGGWDALRARNRALALDAQEILCAALGVPVPAPAAMLGALAAVPLPAGRLAAWPATAVQPQPLQDALLERFGIEVPIMPMPGDVPGDAPGDAGRVGGRLVRVSAQLYNHRGQYVRLAEALQALLV